MSFCDILLLNSFITTITPEQILGSRLTKVKKLGNSRLGHRGIAYLLKNNNNSLPEPVKQLIDAQSARAISQLKLVS